MWSHLEFVRIWWELASATNFWLDPGSGTLTKFTWGDPGTMSNLKRFSALGSRRETIAAVVAERASSAAIRMSSAISTMRTQIYSGPGNLVGAMFPRSRKAVGEHLLSRSLTE